MKKAKVIKIIAGSLMGVSLLALNPIGVSAEWKNDNNGWWYTESNSYVTGWKSIDGKWYYFNSDGYMEHDTTVDGCRLGSNGAWIQDTILATIGDEKITKDDLNKEMKAQDYYLKKQYGNDYATNAGIKEQITKYKKEQLQSLVMKKILLKKAAELNIKPSDDEINKQITDTINKYNSEHPEESYASAVQKYGTTEDEAKESLRNIIIITALEKNITKDITVTDEEVQAYYNKYKDTKFTQAAGANVAHILVADEATAKSLKAKLDAGADFAALAKENSIDPGSKDNGGNLGFIPYDSTEYIAEFMNGFKGLKEGEVSDPVKSQFGYHLIKATGLKEAAVISFDDIKEKIKESLFKEKQEAVIAAKLNEWKNQLNVKIYEDRL